MADREITLNKKIYIYKLTSPNGKIYIGQSTNINVRFSQYKHNRCKGQPKLYYALEKYGWSNFTKEILEHITIDKSDEKERFWIKHFNCIDEGLNCENGGRVNKTHCKETKEKLKNSHMGKKLSSETKRKISESNKGRICSDETRKKISIANKGKKRSQKIKQKMRITFTGRKLKPRTLEHCKKISEFRTGKTHSEETKLKIRKSLLGRKRNSHSEATKKKMSESQKNRKRNPHSNETKEKISQSIKTWHKNRK